MKSLFVKNKYMYGGPWSSFDYNQVTPEWILSKTFSKAGHPFPMICHYQMDCRIVNDGRKFTGWENELYGKNPYSLAAIENLTESVCGWGDIDFSNYDFVYTEDPIIPSEIIENNPNIEFAYNLVEHWDVSKTTHERYKLIDHQQIPFPQSPASVSNFIDRQNSKIHIEYRSNEIAGIHDYLNSNLGLELVYKRNTNFYMITKNPESGLEYWKRMGKSKYNIQLPVNGSIRLGQGFGDASSIGCINLGICSVDHNQVCVHPDCRVDSLSSIVERIKQIEQNGDMAKEILSYQYEAIDDRNERFNQEININKGADR
tara:strand:+ start:1399 stop:2343 length:945 start_codon:yes stop_codon:yes gene_type:complete